MKFNLALLLPVIAAVMMSSAVEEETKLPSVKFKTLDGKTVDIQSYGDNGKPTVVCFWATWCKPCITELNAIADVYEDWQKDYGVEVIAVALDNQRSLARVPGVVKTNGWEYEILTDVNNESYRAFHFPTPPYLLLVDAKGNIQYRHSGYLAGSEEEVEEKLAEITSHE